MLRKLLILGVSLCMQASIVCMDKKEKEEKSMPEFDKHIKKVRQAFQLTGLINSSKVDQIDLCRIIGEYDGLRLYHQFDSANGGHSSLVRALANIPDIKCLASGSQNGAIQLWDLDQDSTTYKTCIANFVGHTSAVYAFFEKDLNLAGIISFEDPIKHEVVDTIKKSRRLGIRFIMLTGDSKEVAFAVANKLDMAQELKEVITGQEFINLKLDEQIKAVNTCNVFARVTPEVKFDIINLLKKDKFVGFLADGINDAPALKAAHVGIVVSKASTIAKEAADIVILKKSLTVIVNGIIQGRKTFANTIKYIKISITSNLGNFYSVALISLLIDFLPLLPLQIILVNILSDLPMVAIASDSVALEDLKRPVNYNIKDIALSSSFFGIISSFFDFLTFSIFFSKGQQLLQTNWFLETLLTELIIIFSLRTRLPFYKAPRPSVFLLFMTFICTCITLYIPFTNIGKDVFKFVNPGFDNILIIFILIFSYFIVTELGKKLYYSYLNNRTF